MQENLVMAYLAGVIDGDGSIMINKKMVNNRLHYVPALTCVKTRPAFIDLLKSSFGGSITIVDGKRHIRKDGTKSIDMYKWDLQGSKGCEIALKKLIPYLQIKKERAETVLDFIDNKKAPTGFAYDQEEMLTRERYYLQIASYVRWENKLNATFKKASRSREDQLFWSYIAGLMDSDGSFSLKKQTINKGTDVKNARYTPYVLLSMTDSRAVAYLYNNCSFGKVYMPKNKSTKTGFHYQFSIFCKKEVKEFIERILPYLRNKLPQAQALLNFCLHSENTRYCKAGIPSKELAYREQCYQQICHLNKYGVSKSDLMGLKPLPGDAEGNKAEAAKAGTVNVVNDQTPKGDAVL